MKPELTREEYSDLIKEYAIMATRLLLIGYGIFFVTLFTTLTGLEETSKWIKPIRDTMGFLLTGFLLLGVGIQLVVVETIFARKREVDRDGMTPAQLRKFRASDEGRKTITFIALSFIFAGSFIFLFGGLVELFVSIKAPSPTIYIWPKEMLGGV